MGDSDRLKNKSWSPHISSLSRRRDFSEDEKNKLHNSLGNLGLLDDDEEDFLSPAKPTSDGNLALAKERRKAGKRPGTLKSSTTTSTTVSSGTSPSSGKRPVKSKSSAGKSPGIKPIRRKSTSKTASSDIKQEDIPIEILEKLMVLTDPETSVRERAEIEVDMSKDPYAKSILVNFRQKFDRKAFLKQKAQMDQEAEAQMAKNIKDSDKKEAEFQKEVARKRQQKIEEEIARAKREAKMLEDARKHAVKEIATGLEQVRKDAEKTVVRAKQNILKKKEEQEAMEREIEEFRRKEGKYMHDAQRALREAMITQKYIDREADN
jgi:hypothetical protein